MRSASAQSNFHNNNYNNNNDDDISLRADCEFFLFGLAFITEDDHIWQ